MERLLGNRAIGHTRYATTGGAGLRNVRPLASRRWRPGDRP
jgi:amidophosphoribosyltransferase